MLSVEQDNFSVRLLFNDDQFKASKVKVKLTLDMEYAKQLWASNSQRDQNIPYFLQWVDAFKRLQRPIWVDPAVASCNICDEPFGLVNRQHHCRKCGTAVCSKCSGD